MLTDSSSERIREHILSLVWSLWAELGVSSWTRHHQQWAIDPEPLVIFTAQIGDADRRLRDEALDWCIRYGSHISANRLRNLLKEAPLKQQSAFETFAATVNAHSSHSWPSSAQPIKYKPTGRSSLGSFTAPALIALRLRALFGVAARAEILRVILRNLDRPFTASDLISDVNYTKRNIDNALESMKMAGLLEVRPVRNQHQYRLTEPAGLLGFVGDCPRLYPRWTPIFVCITWILDLDDRAGELAKQVATVKATRVFREISGFVDEANLVKPATPIVGRDALHTFLAWADDLTGRLAAGDETVFR
jgi:DNA-binding transcriptional ArsR family regulator